MGIPGGSSLDVPPTGTDPPVTKDAEGETSVDLLYNLAVASYDEAQRRSEVTEKRLQELTVVAATLTVGVLTFFANRKLDHHHWAFLAAMASAVAGLAIAFIARLTEQIMLLNISAMWEKWQDLPPEKFKSNFAYFAGKHRDKNDRRVRNKARLTNIAAGLFLLEIIFLGLWVETGGTSAESQSQALNSAHRAPPPAPKVKPAASSRPNLPQAANRAR